MTSPEIIYRWTDSRTGEVEETKLGANRPPAGWLEVTLSTPGDDDSMGNRKRQTYLLSADNARSLRDFLDNK